MPVGVSPRIPILLYHRILASEPDARAELDVSIETFREDMRRLRRRRWRCIDAAEAARLNLSGRRRPKTFALTIDDGTRDFGDLAHPVLTEFGFTATVFVVTGRVGMRGDWLSGAPPALLDADAIRDLAREGVSFGSHGVTHVPLTERTDRDLARDLERSRATLSEMTGKPVEAIAWPYGEHDARTRRAAAAAGYDLGFAVAGDGSLWQRARAAVQPAARDAYAVPRREVHGSDPALRRRLRMGPLDGLFVTVRKVGHTSRGSS